MRTAHCCDVLSIAWLKCATDPFAIQIFLYTYILIAMHVLEQGMLLVLQGWLVPYSAQGAKREDLPMIWGKETSYDAMDHRTVFGEHYCGTHVYRVSEMAGVEGVIRSRLEMRSVNKLFNSWTVMVKWRP
jgi:hypothetical protein